MTVIVRDTYATAVEAAKALVDQAEMENFHSGKVYKSDAGWVRDSVHAYGGDTLLIMEGRSKK